MYDIILLENATHFNKNLFRRIRTLTFLSTEGTSFFQILRYIVLKLSNRQNFLKTEVVNLDLEDIDEYNENEKECGKILIHLQERSVEMGIYLNPGSGRYEEAINSEIFVDKTRLVHYLNSVVRTKQKYVSVSRPRRFGKTMAADMICAYYDRSIDSRPIFGKRKIAGLEGWDIYLNQFDVIRLVMTDFIKTYGNIEAELKKLKSRILDDLSETYADVRYDQDDFFYSMDKFYQAAHTPFVIVIDEWDAIFRVRPDQHEEQKLYLDFLRDWLKDQQYVALTYMTGILPIKKYGVHSALNMFDEFSMTAPGILAQYVGFTKSEVQEICAEKELNFDGFRNWYDGYRLSENAAEESSEEKASLVKTEGKVYEIYSPLSVVSAARRKELGNYWNQTETFEALKVYIERNYDGLKELIAIMMDGGKASVDISTYQNDMTTLTNRDDVLTLLIHLGYLGYDSETEKVFIPNKEVLDVFKSSTKSQEWSASFKALEESQKLLEATWTEDADTVAAMIEAAHEQAGTEGYHSEAAFSYAIQLAYYNARNYYTKILELATGKGFADLVYLPSPEHSDKPALLIELKYNKDADAAIAQIHRQNYPQVLEKYKGNLLLVGISYRRDVPNTSDEFKHHTCKIERA